MQRSSTLKENSEQSHWCAVNPGSNTYANGGVQPAIAVDIQIYIHIRTSTVNKHGYSGIFGAEVAFFWMCKLTVRIIINTNGYNCIHHHPHLTRVWYTNAQVGTKCILRIYSVLNLDIQILHPASCIHYRIRTSYWCYYSPRRSTCMERDDLPSNDKRIYLMLILLQYGSFSAMLTEARRVWLQLSPCHPTWIHSKILYTNVNV